MECHFFEVILGLVPSHLCSWIFSDSMYTHPAQLKQKRTLQHSSRDSAKQKARVKRGRIWPTMYRTRTPMPKSDLHLWDGFFKFRNGLACISPKRIRIHDPWPIHNKILCIYIINHIIIKCATYIHTLHYITLHNTTQHNPTYIHTYIHTSMHAWHCIALHCMALHCIALHDMTLHDMTFHYITCIHT